MDQADYYQVLHVHPDAPKEIIKATYRTLMQKLKAHPDLGGDHGAATLINEAYALLMNDNARTEYDRSRSKNTNHQSTPQNQTRPKAPQRASRQLSRQREEPVKSGLDMVCKFCRYWHNLAPTLAQYALCPNCESPLSRPERLPDRQSGARSIERFPKAQSIQIFSSWPRAPVSGRTINVSLEGMLLESSQELEASTLLKIECNVMRAVGRIAHKHYAGGICRIGVQFVTLRFEQTRGFFVSSKG